MSPDEPGETRPLTRRPGLLASVAALALALVATGALLVLFDGGDPAEEPAAGSGAAGQPREGAEAWAAARSEPVEDSVYPAVGDPGVDALHYGLDLDWDPDDERLTGEATITLRATGAAEESGELRLDLGAPLEVQEVRLDGEEVPAATGDSGPDDGAEGSYAREGKDLVVAAEVAEDEVHKLVVRYAGTPAPVQAPTTRSDFRTTGWTVSDDGDVWTMQEPFGAYSWYPVHDHPSDKAFYDFEISAPSPMVGVANGQLVDRSTEGGVTTTGWELDSAAASYLVTIAIGDYEARQDESPSGVPLSSWVQRGDESGRQAVQATPGALDWVEERLGPYPFDSLGIVLTDSRSGMETQTMITLGDNPYVQSVPVIVHEIVHQWYGNLVTPTDWSDLWMNEGMAMYVQLVYEAERDGVPIEGVMDDLAGKEKQLRREAGPPADYDPLAFGEDTVYVGPALMWQEVRERVGDRAFWRMVRGWPASRAGGNATREEYLAYVEEETGEELTALFDAWLLGETSPQTPG